MKEPTIVVLIPTEDKTNILKIDGNLYLSKKDDKRFKSRSNGENHRNGVFQYVYVIASQDREPIKVGDCFALRGQNEAGVWEIFKNDGEEGLFDGNAKKIIATDDPRLLVRECSEEVHNWGKKFVAQLPQSFLEELVANPDGEWEVEYELDEIATKRNFKDKGLGLWTKGFSKNNVYNLKLNQDNTVNNTLVEEKKIYSLQEHKHDLRTVIVLCKQDPNFRLEDWITKNL